MTLKSLTFLALCAFALIVGCGSDSSKAIAKKWVVLKFSHANETEDEKASSAELVGSTIEFKSDGTLLMTSMGSTETSHWTIHGDSVEMKVGEKGVKEMGYIKVLTDKSFVLVGKPADREMTFEMEPWTESSPKQKPVSTLMQSPPASDGTDTSSGSK